MTSEIVTKSNMHLVVYYVKHNNIFDIIKYFKSFEIAKISIIKFIKNKHSEKLGNIHITIDKWYNNNISNAFYNDLLDPIKTTKLVYDDPKYFEIEFDYFNHEYNDVIIRDNYTFNIYNLSKHDSLSEYLNLFDSEDSNYNLNNVEINEITNNENEITNNENEIITCENENNIIINNNENDDSSSCTDFNNFVTCEEFFELSSEMSSEIDKLTLITKKQSKEINILKKKLECSILRINYLESDINKNLWKNRLRSRHRHK